ncbi:MFS transporter [Phytoactinopolyspora limicola]|uniref:MFS transporter n=1 Tax=Phytoactinopolyspora limicola TaxID=2715536 RepID=UPI001407C46B|nr:MFS transporter [Phytoactinopolyspora limicola]
MARDRGGVPNRLLFTLTLGTVLNPLNSSMIAIALVSVQREFEVSIATSTWAASGFYLAAAVGQPLMGRLADRLGARRLFIAGLVLMGVTSALAPLAPTFGWLLAARVAQAVATSAAFPCAHILIRAAATGPARTPPASALATLSVASSASAALGPVLGGLLVAVAGWEAVFLVNVPITLVGIVLAARILPRVATNAGPRLGVRELDLPGIALTTIALSTLIVLVLSLAEEPHWWLLPVVAAAFALLIWREFAVDEPFMDIRGLVTNRALGVVLVQQGGINLVFYCVFFGLPMWLEHVRGFGPEAVGLLVLPMTVLSIVVIPLTVRAIRRHGPARTLVLGVGLLFLATLAVQVLGDTTPVLVLLGIAVLLGIPNGVNHLGLQTMLYAAAPPDRAGAVAGLFQTFRYLGAISATSVLGVILERDLSSRGMHHVGFVMTGVAAVLLVLTVAITFRPRPLR